MSEKGEKTIFDRADEELKQAAERLSAAVKGLFPPGFSEHLANSQREFLLALRSMIDAALARTEQSIREARERVRPKEPGAKEPGAGEPRAGAPPAA